MELSDAIDWAAERRLRVLITIRADGKPQSSDIVYYVDSGTFSISITADRAKTANLRRDPRAVLHVSDEKASVVRFPRRHLRVDARHDEPRRRHQRRPRRLLRAGGRLTAPRLGRVPPGHDRRTPTNGALHPDQRHRLPARLDGGHQRHLLSSAAPGGAVAGQRAASTAPSTGRQAPLTYRDSSEAKKRRRTPGVVVGRAEDDGAQRTGLERPARDCGALAGVVGHRHHRGVVAQGPTGRWGTVLPGAGRAGSHRSGRGPQAGPAGGIGRRGRWGRAGGLRRDRRLAAPAPGRGGGRARWPRHRGQQRGDQRRGGPGPRAGPGSVSGGCWRST